jgi:hypothetical protein
MIALLLALSLTAHADDSPADRKVAVPPPAIPGGLDKSVIDEKIKGDIDKIAGCYNDNLEGLSPAPKGKVSTRFVINADGHVGTVDIKSSELKNDVIEGCLAKELKTLVFPAPVGGGTVEVDYPFVFSPKKAGGKKK